MCNKRDSHLTLYWRLVFSETLGYLFNNNILIDINAKNQESSSGVVIHEVDVFLEKFAQSSAIDNFERFFSNGLLKFSYTVYCSV